MSRKRLVEIVDEIISSDSKHSVIFSDVVYDAWAESWPLTFTPAKHHLSEDTLLTCLRNMFPKEFIVSGCGTDFKVERVMRPQNVDCPECRGDWLNGNFCPSCGRKLPE